jgi:hypothetical protein
MRIAAAVIVIAGLFVATDASAYPRVERRGDFGAFMARLGTAAHRHDMRTLRQLTDRKFTVGQKLDRRSSLATVDHEPGLRHALAVLAEFGGCYRTGANLVQCETPDPGPELDYARLTHVTSAIFERTRDGWKMNEISASYFPR